MATVKQMMPTAITMLAVRGCAKVMGYAGMIGAISSFCIAVTGALFPLMAPVIGAVGAIVTASGTSSGVLFGSVQQQAAEALGMDPYWMGALFPLMAPVIGAVGAIVTASGTSSGVLFGSVQQQAAEALGMDPYWMVALNSLGVGAGKTISPQTLAIGMAAVMGMDPYWMVALNSLGVGAGKTISPQTLAIGMAAVKVVGLEGKLLSRARPIAVVFMVLMAAMGLAGAMLL